MKSSFAARASEIPEVELLPVEPAGVPSVESEPIPRAITQPPSVQQESGLQNIVWLTGYVVSGSKVNVTLADGRVYTELDGELHQLNRNSVTIDGRKISCVR